ncbi:MAG: RNA polymerase factor sigma-54 [Calditrichaeota bacterium]|nr:RNA polymerase factor sigma-54 [Calditrichota bacterium]MCB0288998.1 RNA polymerase factor sigma-54 [Calditrichota bacterium]MCB0303229.1 RNA polymerase factor sigma-54 [Calditrichota bacterium]MCB9090557.1 RNA polymerase factor sigma-54 [Calditrichia bacterium]
MAKPGLGYGLYQTQSQVLKPQQILVSTLLQLPMLMLEQKIKMELEKNPVLEEAEDWEDVQDDDEDVEIDASKEEKEKIEEEFDTLEENNKSDEDKLNEEVEKEIDVEDLLPGEDDIPEPRIQRDPNEEERDMPEAYQETMSEYLMQQLHMLKLGELEFSIGEYIIYNLRDDGWLDTEVTTESIALIFETDPGLVERVLKRVQRMDPVGIAARNLRECLMVQLEVKRDTANGHYDIPLRILRDCYEDFVNRRFEKVADQLGISLDQVKASLQEIGKLNPKPGEGYADAKQNYILPDFFVELVDGELVISLNDYKTPGLRISNYYKKMLRQPKKLVDKEVRKFLKDKIDSAKWFIKAIRQRQVTMQKTMEAIVERQKDFFMKGPEHIKPMIMKDIAEVIEMDISTVSRVCKGKYVETDYGVFELKYFFNEGMETDEGDALSTLRIKDRLKEIIESENPRKPYSDDKLGKMLNDEGIPIARRTVAKYREQLDIPVARLRRSI